MRRWTVVAVAAVLVLVAAGCGSSSKKSSASSSGGGSGGAYSQPSGSASSTSSGGAAAGGGAQVKLAADEEGKLYFNPRKLTAKAGTVTLVMSNPKTTGKQHGIAVEGNGIDKNGPIVGAGSTSKVTVNLKPGKYTFYCPVPGHRQGGMQGTLTVQ
jgi:uncharacterized cupredoxin-like copper-binding protein